MEALKKQFAEKLDKKDKELIEQFISKVVESKKYKKLRDELNERREDIKKGDVISFDEFFKDV
ncbi:hypothetical protein Flexsi_1267 [Flexistipes sinusarabici DSM 4947]|uniref:Uncharacterized protein n=1 Tax=Flexistipes sinusarabici (strain ATCC 49648 / DSM 4947 / MAS 10) TaxID=717231 RepID=F8E758_FLESM|nr:hypothetical protein [Flexistipes sinusarabici]AEI14921.1 hypothetical protein Flexsi_1267 [Flexistipes sinusarabici DSM 4947]